MPTAAVKRLSTLALLETLEGALKSSPFQSAGSTLHQLKQSGDETMSSGFVKSPCVSPVCGQGWEPLPRA